MATLPKRDTAGLLERLENVQSRQAKVDFNKVAVGRIVARCFGLAGLSQKEAAATVDVDQAQISRWLSGAERPQLDALWAVESLREPLIIALCEAAGIGIETVVRIVRRA